MYQATNSAAEFGPFLFTSSTAVYVLRNSNALNLRMLLGD